MAINAMEGDPRPLPLDMTHHLSRVTQRRQASSLKAFYKYFSIPGIGQLAGGLPHPNYFPYDSLEAQSALPNRFIPSAPEQLPQRTSFFSRTKTVAEVPTTGRILVPHKSTETDPLFEIDLNTALQYSTAIGYPPLANFVRNFVRTNLHPNCPYNGGPDIILSCGNTDGWSKCLEAFTNVWDSERDWLREREGVLCEDFSYPGAMAGLVPRGLNRVNVAMDRDGMLVDGERGLVDVLENWDLSKGKRPHLMYLVTTGQNPTGTVMSMARRRQIYAVCQKFDIIIVEDEPYWFLQFRSTMVDPSHNFNTTTLDGKSSGHDFLDGLVPSFISIDTDGRVIRLDTFSKNVAPGCRLGWITAQPALTERILRIAESTTAAPSGFVQALIAELLIGPGPAAPSSATSNAKPNSVLSVDKTAGWSTAGWVQWLEGLRDGYEKRMLSMATPLHEGKYLVHDNHNTKNQSGPSNLPRMLAGDSTHHSSEPDYHILSKTQMFNFITPQAGMFLWMEMLFESHPLFHQMVSARLSHAFWVFLTTAPYRLLISPGLMFSMSPAMVAEQGWRFFRLCFAAVDEDVLGPMAAAFVKASRDFWEIDDVQVLEKLLSEDEQGTAAALADKMETMKLAEGRFQINPMMY